MHPVRPNLSFQYRLEDGYYSQKGHKITLSEHTSMTKRLIAKEYGVCLGAVNKILKQKKDTGTNEANRRGKCGRKRRQQVEMKVFI